MGWLSVLLPITQAPLSLSCPPYATLAMTTDSPPLRCSHNMHELFCFSIQPLVSRSTGPRLLLLPFEKINMHLTGLLMPISVYS
ncbi:uncharacterized protein BO66DRAFT_145568 [Aspergillus aculeatinus CBS 121060]|uniref:Uncharacterized protein n=1 Tax=Aspergillus aculeatinus CBS 121060 TaxID=1448322 RepID=A0ACD1HL06_9EURO|nr:hypothetical protein BO66DRAFT_145568 [Aspergillus aculeatinus CBS 121060]RAH74283.1 hypothetical protein BO66DRAFT_145568 [Aspergillus aculeatinus CBS 121060]